MQVGGQVVLFGGESDSGPLDDVWLLGGWGEGQTLRWTQLRLRTPPAARFGHAMAGEASPMYTPHVLAAVEPLCDVQTCSRRPHHLAASSMTHWLQFAPLYL
jgi:hypothetical protein